MVHTSTMDSTLFYVLSVIEIPFEICYSTNTEISMSNFMQKMFAGVNDDVSSKRVITFMSFLCCMFAFLCNVFMKIHLEEYVFNGMLYLTGAGLGFSAFEKFSPSASVSKAPSVTVQPDEDQPPF